MPDKGNEIKFKNHKPSITAPFMIYADFEAFIIPISSCEPSSHESFTNKYEKHETDGSYYQIVCFDDKLHAPEPVIYRANSEDEDVSQIFVQMLGENIKNIYKEFDFVKKMIFTHEDKLKFIVEVFFWICKDSLNDDKVRDLCHFAGKYRGAAHYKCNLQFEKPKFSPIIFTTGLVMNLIYIR